MDALIRLEELINEVDKLCETVEEENKVLKEKIEEQNEKMYFDMCTDLAPYYSLVLDKFPDKSINICLSNIVKNPRNGLFYNINIVFLYTTVRIEIKSSYGGTYYECVEITSYDKDFLSYENIDKRNDKHKKKLLNNIIKVWSTEVDMKEFEQKFMAEVQRILTNKANKLNRENQELKNKLNS